MTLPADYLEYPLRKHGMDHDRYEWSNLFERTPVKWPNGARVALMVSPALEWFPFDMGQDPFPPPGGLMRPYPDYWDYTYRDYGNRVGIYRIAKVLDELGIKASVTVNSALAERHPSLIEDLVGRDWEIVASGVDMGHLHHGGLSEDDERTLVQQSLNTLREASGQAVTGWWSPANSASNNTLDLLAAEGVEYVGDWNNDDLPYELRTANGTIYSMPHSSELSDRQILLAYHHSSQEFADQILAQFQVLHSEAGESGGRVMSLTLHPWLTGQPHRIATLKSALSEIMDHDGVWAATGSEILAAFKDQS